MGIENAFADEVGRVVADSAGVRMRTVVEQQLAPLLASNLEVADADYERYFMAWLSHRAFSPMAPSGVRRGVAAGPEVVPGSEPPRGPAMEPDIDPAQLHDAAVGIACALFVLLLRISRSGDQRSVRRLSRLWLRILAEHGLALPPAGTVGGEKISSELRYSSAGTGERKVGVLYLPGRQKEPFSDPCLARSGCGVSTRRRALSC
jgi:hypothetical protein